MSWTLPVYFRRGFWYQAETAQDIHSPPPQAWGRGGGGLKISEKSLLGGQKFYFGGGEEFCWGTSRNFEVKTKTA